MNIIWANRLVAGTKTWAEMPASRRVGVKKVLAERVNKRSEEHTSELQSH